MSVECKMPREGPALPLHAATSSTAAAPGIADENATSSAYTASSSVYDWPAADSPAPDAKSTSATLSQSVKRRIRRLYRTLRRGGDPANADANIAPTPPPVPRPVYQLPPPPPPSALAPGLLLSERRTATDPSTCVSMNNSDRDRIQSNVSNSNLKSVNPIIVPAGSTGKAAAAATAVAASTASPGEKDEDLYTVLTVDAEELRSFYSGIFVVAECEGKRIKTKRTNRLEDIQTSFIFYRRHPTKNPIEFKMFANHLTLGRRVLIGELSLTLQPGEPFDGMSVRRSIRERPELRTNGGSGLLFNFLSGTLHTQHLSGV